MSTNDTCYINDAKGDRVMLHCGDDVAFKLAGQEYNGTVVDMDFRPASLSAKGFRVMLKIRLPLGSAVNEVELDKNFCWID